MKLIRITTVPQSLRGLLQGQLKFMVKNGFEVVGISSPGEILKDVSKNEGVRTIAVEMTRTISPLNDLRSLICLYKILKKEKPEIVHTHTPKAGIVGMLAAKMAGVPRRLHTVAGMPLLVASGKKRKLLDIVERITYGCATKVYPNSNGLYDIILKNKYTSSKKLKVIGEGSSNGIDTSYFNPDKILEVEKNNLKQSLNIKLDEFVFIFVGRLVKDKGINELVEAFENLKSKYPKIKLILVGSYEKDLDPLLQNTENTIKEDNSIIEVGFQKDVRPYFAIADVLTFPSYREGFPNVVMQAGAMGLPSIVTDINGCNEIIEEGINGLIVSPKRVNELIDAMRFVLINKKKVDEMKSNARILICERYERKLMWKEILKEYHLLLTN